MYLTMCDTERVVRSLYNKDLYDHNFQDYVMPQECSMRFIAEVYERTSVPNKRDKKRYIKRNRQNILRKRLRITVKVRIQHLNRMHIAKRALS